MKKSILLLLIIVATFSTKNLLLAQVTIIPEEESLVDISPAELQLLLEELMEAKKKRIAFLAANPPSSSANGGSDIQAALEEQNLRQQMDDMQKKINSIHGKMNQETQTSTAAINRQDLDFLKKQLLGEMKSLKEAFFSLTLKTTPSASPINSSNQPEAELAVFAAQMMQLRTALDSLFLQMNELVGKEEFKQLGQQLTALENKLQGFVHTNPTFDEQLVQQWDNQFKELRAILEKVNKNTPIPVAKTPSDNNYEFLKELAKNRKQDRIFFKVNSSELTKEDQPALQETATLVNTYEKLDVLVVGYTDKKGNSFYNKELSQKRAEAVKKYLMKQGIHPNRIFSQSNGMDYAAENPAAARRVDLILLVNR